jgi:hypothetical protein
VKLNTLNLDAKKMGEKEKNLTKLAKNEIGFALM